MTKPKAEITIPEVAPWIQDYYRQPGNAVGGSLHIVLDDGNWEQCFIEECEQEAIRKGDAFGAFLARVLAQMSGGQRRRLAKIRWWDDRWALEDA